MTPQELKNSILQLAVQGKLSIRLKSDGNARDLLAVADVDDIFDGQRVKQKTITAIKDVDRPLDIPDAWEWIKLGSVCVIARGGSPRPIKDFITTANDGVNWIKIGDTEKAGKYITSTAEKIKPSGIIKSRMVHTGDFLLTNSMSFGRPYILKVDGCIHDGWLVISQKTEVLDQDYLYWLLSSRYAYMQFCEKVSGGVVKNLNSDKVANSVFPLPPLAEQKRIVAKIEELLPYIDRYEQAWGKLEDFNKRFPVDMQKSILQTAIQGKLVEQRPEEGTAEKLYRQIQAEKQRLIKEGKIKKEKPLPKITEDEVPFEIPESWKWVRIGQIFTLQAGKNIATSEIFDSSSPEHPFLCYGGNGIRGYVSSSNRAGYYALIGRQGALCGNINFANGEFYATEHAVVVDHLSMCDVIWSGYFLRTLNLNQYATATAQPGLAVSNIVNVPIPLPPLAEQKRIVAKLEDLLPLCERLK